MFLYMSVSAGRRTTVRYVMVGEKEVYKIPFRKGNRSALESSSGEFMRG